MAVLEIGRKIGRGGMAEVRLASARGLGGFARLVVQKRILPVGNDVPFVPRVMPDVRKLFHGFHSDPE